MAKFIKLTLLVDGEKEQALIDMADIHGFRRNVEGTISVWYKSRDPEDGSQYSDVVAEPDAATISKILKGESMMYDWQST